MASSTLTTYRQHVEELFGEPVRKLSVDAGLTCPNRDGTLGRGGCTYCNNESFVPSGHADVAAQLREQIERVSASRRPARRFIAYFQAHTNTYGPLDTLRSLYDSALSVPGVAGLAVGTRPDCVADSVLELLASYARRVPVWLELGLESSHDATLRRINRGHGAGAYADALRRVSGRGLHLCTHLILGLPGEDRRAMRETAAWLAERFDETEAPSMGVKLHHLHIVRNTPLEAAYERGKVTLLSPDEYIEAACDVIERLPASTVYHRLVGDTQGDTLVAPHWIRSKQQILSGIRTELERRGTGAGALA
jgi:hypothetical protein